MNGRVGTGRPTPTMVCKNLPSKPANARQSILDSTFLKHLEMSSRIELGASEVYSVGLVNLR